MGKKMGYTMGETARAVSGTNDKLIARGAAAQLRVRQKAFDPLNLLDNASAGSVSEGSEHPHGVRLRVCVPIFFVKGIPADPDCGTPRTFAPTASLRLFEINQ